MSKNCLKHENCGCISANHKRRIAHIFGQRVPVADLEFSDSHVLIHFNHPYNGAIITCRESTRAWATINIESGAHTKLDNFTVFMSACGRVYVRTIDQNGKLLENCLDNEDFNAASHSAHTAFR